MGQGEPWRKDVERKEKQWGVRRVWHWVTGNGREMVRNIQTDG